MGKRIGENKVNFSLMFPLWPVLDICLIRQLFYWILQHKVREEKCSSLQNVQMWCSSSYFLVDLNLKKPIKTTAPWNRANKPKGSLMFFETSLTGENKQCFYSKVPQWHFKTVQDPWDFVQVPWGFAQDQWGFVHDRWGFELFKSR